VTGKLAIHSTSMTLALSFSLFNPVISDSFSLDTGKYSFPSRTSTINLSIKRENASLLIGDTRCADHSFLLQSFRYHS